MDMRRRFLTEQAKIFKALGHPSRLLIVDALRQGEKCVGELQELVGDDMSTISNHLSVLRVAGIISGDKRGKNIYYKLILCCLDSFLSCTGDLVRNRVLSHMDMIDSQDK